MNINDCNVSLENRILVISSTKKTIDLDDLAEIKIIMEDSTGHVYRYGMYKDIVGYYKGYDFLINRFIYCASLNKKSALELMQNYIDEQIT
ncbi:MAG: hypothetical protein ACOH2V_00735 [Candidatus Saccharimonadaceae bacterium]